MSDNLQEVTKKYLKSPNTDYAILINGEWGSGKTFYLRRTLMPFIETLEYSKDEKGKPQYFTTTYISLYGLTTTTEIADKILFNMNPGLTKVLSIGTSVLGKLIEKKGGIKIDKEVKSFISLYNIPKHRVLIFDDLERVESKTLNEVLGFINSYTEHEHLKVIIVANEAELKKKSQTEKIDYKEAKEKLIRFTFSFAASVEKSFPSLIDQYTESYILFLNENKDIIFDAFRSAEYANLRTLNFILDTFSLIHEYITIESKLPDKFASQALERFLFSLTLYSVEYKKHHDDLKLSHLKSLTYTGALTAKQFALRAGIDRNSLTKMEENKTKSDEVQYKELIEDTYLENTRVPFYFYDWLRPLTHSGILLKQKLVEDYKKIHAELQDVEVKPAYQKMKKLENVLVLENSELLELLPEVLLEVENGAYKLDEYVPLFNLLEEYEANIPNLISIDEKVIDIFKNGIDKSVNHSDFIIRLHYRTRGPESITEKSKLIMTHAMQANETLLAKKEVRLAERIKEAMSPFNILKFQSVIDDNNDLQLPFFHLIDVDSFYNFIVSLNNSEKKDLIQILRTMTYRYFDHNPALQKELAFFRDLQTKLDTTNEVLVSKTHCMWLSNICKEIVADLAQRFR